MRQRSELLFETGMFEVEEWSRSINKLDTKCNVAELVSNLFNDFPSYETAKTCMKTETKKSSTLKVNLNPVFEQGFQSLQQRHWRVFSQIKQKMLWYSGGNTDCIFNSSFCWYGRLQQPRIPAVSENDRNDLWACTKDGKCWCMRISIKGSRFVCIYWTICFGNLQRSTVVSLRWPSKTPRMCSRML